MIYCKDIGVKFRSKRVILAYKQKKAVTDIGWARRQIRIINKAITEGCKLSPLLFKHTHTHTQQQQEQATTKATRGRNRIKTRQKIYDS